MQRFKNHNNFIVLVLLISTLACKKANDAVSPSPPAPPPDDNSTLKETADFAVGAAISYTLMKNNSTYKNLVKDQFDRVTFEYQMKHGANVQPNGQFDFANTDELVNIAQAAGLEVYGHTLVWHQNNNGNYLRSLTTSAGPNILANADFENDFGNWSTQVSATAPTAGTISIVDSDVQSGARAARVMVNTPGPDPWSIQLYSDQVNVTAGNSYTLKFWAKASTTGQVLRAVSQGNSFYVQQSYTLTNSWEAYSLPFTPSEGAIAIKFHFPYAGEFYLDHLTVAQQGTQPDAEMVEQAMKDWITALVGRYKTSVKAWDVVNEVIDDNGNFRTGSGNGDVFFWYPVLGESYIASAFKYAHEADPAATLFINDFNLESSPAKLNALIALVDKLKAAGVPVHGIATQMHISINTPNQAIDNMFTRLAATGLKVHVSELDVRINPGSSQPFATTPALLEQQAQKYRYVAQSYRSKIPATQRYGITVWNVTDADSWIVTSLGQTDFPCLFDGSYGKKPAYVSFREGLKQ